MVVSADNHPLRVQDLPLQGRVSAGRRAVASVRDDAFTGSRRELRRMTAAKTAATSRQLLQTASLTDADVKTLMCGSLYLSHAESAAIYHVKLGSLLMHAKCTAALAHVHSLVVQRPLSVPFSMSASHPSVVRASPVPREPMALFHASDISGACYAVSRSLRSSRRRTLTREGRRHPTGAAR